MSYTVGAVSLGCSKNRVDTETALSILQEDGFRITQDFDEADILMVNTCGFITSAKQEAIDMIIDLGKYKTEGRCRLLVVTGCLAQRYGQELMNELPEIDLLLGVNQYASLPKAIREAMGGKRIVRCGDDLSCLEHDRVLTTPPWYAYVRIGEGCSNRCAFCAIPLIRGPYRSRSREAILSEVRSLAAKGVKEQILIAQDTTRYGTDDHGPSALPSLMREAAKTEGLEWLRVLYCYPDETREELLDTLADTPHICPYLDLPIQHINPDILRRMRRRGGKEDILRCVRGAKERGLTLRTTLIVGFPGETEDQFRELLDFVEETGFDRLGAFAYSPEENTPAAEMPFQVPDKVKEERLDRLMRLQQSISFRKNKERIGTEVKVLVTEADPKTLTALGRSEREVPEVDGDILIRCDGETPVPGSFIRVRITGAEPYDLKGRWIRP